MIQGSKRRTMTIETVAVTGGNGKIGEAILENLNDHDYRTVNVARGKRREEVSDEYRTTDLLDAGKVYGSLAASNTDAVIHMGTIPAPTSHPGYITYESNVMSSYHVLEAATGLGLESVCLASSINAMGSVYQDEPMEVFYLPVDEDHPLTPRDPYALGKHAIEITADGFGRLNEAPHTVSTLRYPWVATGTELAESFAATDRSLPGLEDAWHHTTRDTLFSYIHIEDAADIARLAIEADYEGHERFWAVAPDTTTDVHSERLAEEYYPEAELREPLDEREALIDISKARELLGWNPERTWRRD
jgi:nucleoside-diphosphate-sugar epimerase